MTTAASIAKELRARSYLAFDADTVGVGKENLATLIEAFEAMGEALKPFASIAEMESKSPDGASVFVNVSRCRDAAGALAKAGL